MSKYHSTLSRREFLKTLGLGGAGIGATALGVAAAPKLARPVHDLDEVISSSLAVPNRPSYVKEVDKPTIEVDWTQIKRFDYSNVMWATGFQKALGSTQFDLVSKAQQGNRLLRLKQNKPGYTLKDDAFVNASISAAVSFLGPQSNSTPADLGVPRYEGTPEENARMIRSFMRFHGAAQVGFVQLDTDTTEKLLYSYDNGGSTQGPKLTIADVDQPSETKTERIVPKKARWVIVYTIRMADELMRRAPTQLVVAPTMLGYSLASRIQGSLQLFLRGLGYMGIGEARFNALGSAVGLGIMAGLGEHSRAMHMITPEYGLRQRAFKLITDLPLAPGKPVDFGVMRFCRVCKKCSDICPAKAINPETEPSWAPNGDYQQTGIKSWHRIEPLCLTYIKQAGYSQGCILCFAVCPLSKGKRETVYQDLIRRTIATTPVFDRAIRKMDDLLGNGQRSDPETFWDLDLPPFGWD
ncbi:MAG: reductive dehalogenase [Dehalococcoidia bacterium]|nr:MAG: reductive dehalogenase [Dehalococcoidia bacterium]